MTDDGYHRKGWWYLSFADDHGFLGAVVIQGDGMEGAIKAAHALGIDPGGEVIGAIIPDDHIPPEAARGKLLDREAVRVFWPDAMSEAEHEERERKSMS